MTDSRFQILLVEDSPTDQLLAREALSAAGGVGKGIDLNIVCDGVAKLLPLRIEIRMIEIQQNHALVDSLPGNCVACERRIQNRTSVGLKCQQQTVRSVAWV